MVFPAPAGPVTIHSRLRRAGKGIAFQPQPGHLLPVNVPTAHLEEVIAL